MSNPVPTPTTFKPGSVDEALDLYATYLAAEKKILLGQSYQIGTRMLHRADLGEVVRQRKYWGIAVARLSNQVGHKVTRVIMRDQ